MELVPVDYFIELVEKNFHIIKLVGGIGLVIIAITILVSTVLQYRKKQKRKNYPNDVVILHQVPRGLRAPSASPFALKLETFLRMAKISYQNDFSYEFSSKNMIPFITYSGQDFADSQFCIEYLTQKLNINLTSNLTEEQKAIGRAVLKLTEESLRWIMVIDRFIYTRDSSVSGLPRFVHLLFYRQIKNRLYEQGYGRHSKEEAYSIGKSDMKALNDIIGNKRYFLSNEYYCDVDAAVFGLLCQLAYHSNGVLYDYFKNECLNLVRFEKTIREEFWSDWNENVKEPLKN